MTTLGVWSAESGVKGEYLSKTEDDTAQGKLTINGGVDFPLTSSGIGISGTDGDASASVKLYSAKRITLRTANETRLIVRENGRVGIGLTDPTEKLQVSGNVKVVGGGNLFMQDGARVQFGSSDSASIFGKEGSSDGYISLAPNSEIVRVTATGKVGINETSPKQTLTVRGPSNDNINADTGFIRFQGDGNNGLLMGNQASSPFSFYLQSGFITDLSVKYALSLNPLGGYVGVNTIDPRVNLEVKKGQNAIEYYPAEYRNRYAASILNCLDGSTEHGLFVANRWAGKDSQALEVGSLYSSEGSYNSYFRVRGDGYVGIGRTDPKARLDVNGHARVGEDGGVGFVQYGASGNASLNYHIGTDGTGSLAVYRGVIGSGTTQFYMNQSGEAQIWSNVKIAPPTTNGEGGDLVLLKPNQSDPGLTLDVLDNSTYRLFTTNSESTLLIGNLGSGAHYINFYCGDGVSPLNITQGYSLFNKDLRFGYTNTQVFPGIGNTDFGGVLSISSTSGTVLVLSRKDGDAVALNRTGTNGDLMTFRKNGAIKGSIEIDDSNIRITGLAGGPLFRNGFNIDSTEGLIEAFKDALTTIADLENRVQVLEGGNN